MDKNEFEKYWKENREQILSKNDEYVKAKNCFKMTSGADWLLFAFPVVAGILFMNYCPIKHELLKWLASAVVTIIIFVICVWIKSMTSDSSSPEELEQKIKEQVKKQMSGQV